MNNYDLLVIGNGCDINLGYKTKYGDFLTSINIAYKHENFNNYQNFMKETQKIDVDIEY